MKFLQIKNVSQITEKGVVSALFCANEQMPQLLPCIA